MIAHYLKTKKPKSKLVILDPKKAFSKQPVITEAFEKYYKDIIELNLTTEIDDFSVASLDPKTKEIVTKAGKRVKADVANIIPAAACRRDRRQGRLHRGRLVPDQPRQLRLQEGEGRLRAGRRGDRGGDAQVGVLGQQPGQGRGGRHPGRARQEGAVPGALPQHLLVAAGARRQRQDRRQLCAQGRQARFLRTGSCRSGARPPTCASRTTRRASAGTTPSPPTCSPDPAPRPPPRNRRKRVSDRPLHSWRSALCGASRRCHLTVSHGTPCTNVGLRARGLNCCGSQCASALLPGINHSKQESYGMDGPRLRVRPLPLG